MGGLPHRGTGGQEVAWQARGITTKGVGSDRVRVNRGSG